MKVMIFPVLFGGFLITFIFLGISFSQSSLNFQKIEKRLEEQNKKISTLEEKIDQPKVEVTNNNPKLTSKEDNIYTDLLSPENLNYTLGTTTNLHVSLKKPWNQADIYESSKANSKIVGQAKSDTSYQVIEKKDSWYHIKINNNQEGWIQNNFVDEKP